MSERAVRMAPGIGRAVAYAVALLVAAPYAYHLARGSNAYLGLFEDDYFYYAIIADKLVTLGKLTWDGTTVTNGFHPLWFVILLALRVVAGGLNGAFYWMLVVLFVASMVATYELARLFARRLGASPALASAAALAYSVATDGLVASGMETAVGVPLLFGLLAAAAKPAPMTPRRSAMLGGLAAAAILARLDIGLVVAVLLVGWVALARPPVKDAVRSLFAFGAAGLCVPVYAALNVALCGAVLPTSALAKQLVKRPGLNVGYLKFIFFSSPFGRGVGLMLALGLAAALVLWRARRRHDASPGIPAGGAALFVGATALVFACAFFVLNALSGWTFFGWYAYPLPMALVAALVFAGAWVARRIPAERRATVTALVFAAACIDATVEGAYWFTTRGPLWSVEDNGLLAMSYELGDRLRDRPGVYGMGAIAGFVTYVLQRPLVQLEGLVADRSMVEHIRAEDDLVGVMHRYGVDYLIVSTFREKLEPHEGCYAVTEPDAEWAGRRTAKMHGAICAEPIVHFMTRLPQHPWSEFSTLETFVFDVRSMPEHASLAAAR